MAVFPSLQLSLLSWLALAPLFAVCVHPRSRARLLLYGYVTGLVFFTGSCYWIFDVMRLHGNLPVISAAGVLALLVAVLALYPALFSLLAGELARRWRLRAIFVFPFLWVALEWVRTHAIFQGFPWNSLGYAVAPHTGWIQPAAYAGIYGVSFLVAAVNGLVAACWVEPARRRLWVLAAVVVALVASAWWGSRLPEIPPTHRAGLVQTNLPQLTSPQPGWAQNHTAELEEFAQLTQAAVGEGDGRGPALVVWPEVPVSLYFHQDPVLRARLSALARNVRSYLVVGIVDFRHDEQGQLHPYNSAVLLSPDGAFIGQYDKMHLVPFGEYLPWENLFGLAKSLVAEVSSFRPGTEPVVMPAGENRVAVFICYEAIFPALVRQFVRRGAEVLVNISNDGWFGRSAAAAQHLNMARVRAVETRRFLLRATNTGITAVIDPRGRVVARAPGHERAYLAAGFTPLKGETFYVRYGDWFPALCAFVVVIAIARKLWMTAVEETSDAGV